MIYHTRRSKND